MELYRWIRINFFFFSNRIYMSISVTMRVPIEKLIRFGFGYWLALVSIYVHEQIHALSKSPDVQCTNSVNKCIINKVNHSESHRIHTHIKAHRVSCCVVSWWKQSNCITLHVFVKCKYTPNIFIMHTVWIYFMFTEFDGKSTARA